VGGAPLSGQVIDCQTGQGVPNVTISANGLQAQTGPTGNFQFMNVPTAQPVNLSVTGMGYATSQTTLTLPAAGTTAAKVVAIKTADLAARAQSAGVQQAPNTGVLLATLHRGQGGGREGVQLNQITLTPAGVGSGARAFNAQNQPAQATGADGRVWFFNLTPGPYTLAAVYPQDNDGGGGGGTGGGAGTGGGNGGGIGGGVGGAGTGTVVGGNTKTAMFTVTGAGLVTVDVNQNPAAAGFYDDVSGDSSIFGGCAAGGVSSFGSLLIGALAMLFCNRRRRSA
jgi:hypothetical protein